MRARASSESGLERRAFRRSGPWSVSRTRARPRAPLPAREQSAWRAHAGRRCRSAACGGVRKQRATAAATLLAISCVLGTRLEEEGCCVLAVASGGARAASCCCTARVGADSLALAFMLSEHPEHTQTASVCKSCWSTRREREREERRESAASGRARESKRRASASVFRIFHCLSEYGEATVAYVIHTVCESCMLLYIRGAIPLTAPQRVELYGVASIYM